MSCRGAEGRMIDLRREVIREVLKVHEESYRSLKVSDYVIDPDELTYPINKPMDKTLYKVSDMIALLKCGKKYVDNDIQQRKIHELLNNEEITNISLLSILGGRDLKDFPSNEPEYERASLRINTLSDRPQLLDLMNILAEIAPQYDDIGTALNVPMSSLGLPDAMNPDEYRANLGQTLEWWLINGDSVGSPVTYNTIINAIEGPIVQNYRLSQEIKKLTNEQ
jgi:hypothetical protein